MLSPSQNAMISLLLASFPQFQNGDAESALTAYELAIAEYPDADLADGVKAFVQGRVPGHNMAFAPTAPQLASACRRAMEARVDEANRHRRAVLQIEARDEDAPKNSETRARVAALVQGALKNLSMYDEPKAADNEAKRAALLKKHDERFPPTLRYTVGDPDAEDGDMGNRGAA